MKIRYLSLMAALLLGGCILPPPADHPHAQPGPPHAQPAPAAGPGACGPQRPC